MGRRHIQDELLMHKVIDMSWQTVFKALNSKVVCESEKVRIAIEIVKKSCPKEINLVQTKEQKIVIVYPPNLKEAEAKEKERLNEVRVQRIPSTLLG